MDDAVIFDDAGFTVDRVRDEREYGGLRIKTNATVDGARIQVVIDIGFGDATEPGLSDTELPVLLGMPAPNLRVRADLSDPLGGIARNDAQPPGVFEDGVQHADGPSGDAGEAVAPPFLGRWLVQDA